MFFILVITFSFILSHCRSQSCVIESLLPLGIVSHQTAHDTVSNCTYLFGGWINGQVYINTIYKRNMNQTDWIPLNVFTPTSTVYTRAQNSVTIHRIVYFIGIMDSSNSQSDKIYKFNMQTEEWLSNNELIAPLDPSTFGCVTTNQTHLFMIGGKFIECSGSLCHSDSLQIYNINDNSWIQEVINISPIDGNGWKGAYCHVVNTELYVFGGYVGNSINGRIDKIFKYNSFDKWLLVSDTLPIAASYGATVYNHPYIYLVGGRDESSMVALNSIIEFDIRTETITNTYIMEEGIKNMDAEIINDKVYIFGGDPGDGIASKNVEQCDILKSISRAPSRRPSNDPSRNPFGEATSYPTSTALSSNPTVETLNPSWTPAEATLYPSSTPLPSNPTLFPSWKHTEASLDTSSGSNTTAFYGILNATEATLLDTYASLHPSTITSYSFFNVSGKISTYGLSNTADTIASTDDNLTADDEYIPPQFTVVAVIIIVIFVISFCIWFIIKFVYKTKSKSSHDQRQMQQVQIMNNNAMVTSMDAKDTILKTNEVTQRGLQIMHEPLSSNEEMDDLEEEGFNRHESNMNVEYNMNAEADEIVIGDDEITSGNGTVQIKNTMNAIDDFEMIRDNELIPGPLTAEGVDSGQCVDCGQLKEGRTYDGNGSFYCHECYDNYVNYTVYI